MSNKIKVDGDFSGVKKGILDLAKSIKGLSSKNTTQLFGKEDSEILSKQTLGVTKLLKSELEGVSKAAARYKALMKSSNLSSQRQAEAAKKYVKSLKEQVVITKELESLSGSSSPKAISRSRLSKMGGGFAKGASAIPGVGRLTGIGSMGLMAGVGMAGAGALVYGGSRMYKGYQQYKGGADQRLSMRARGISDVSGISSGLAGLGYTPGEVRSQQSGARRAFGVSGSSQNSTLERAQFERGYGLDKGALLENTKGMRNSLGEKKTQEAMFKIQGAILASKLGDEIGPFLETSAAMLTSMNENGIPADAEVLALMASMKEGGTPEGKAMKRIMGADSAIKNSSGDNNAFLQQIYSGAGIGGGTVGGAQEAIALGGLFGIDKDKLKDMGLTKEQMGNLDSLNISDKGFSEKAGALLEYSDSQFGKGGQEQLRKGNFYKGILGTQTGTEAIGLLENLRKVLKEPEGESRVKKIEEFKNKMRDAQKSPDEKLSDKLRSKLDSLLGSDSDIVKEAGRSAKALEILGSQGVGIAITGNKILTSIDQTISKVAEFFGAGPSDEVSRQRSLEKEKEGFKRFGTSRGSLKDMSQEARDRLKAQLEKERAENSGPTPMKTHARTGAQLVDTAAKKAMEDKVAVDTDMLATLKKVNEGIQRTADLAKQKLDLEKKKKLKNSVKSAGRGTN